MKYNISYSTNQGSNIRDKQLKSQILVKDKSNGQGLSTLIKGQQVCGKVTSVNNKVGLMINGQEIFAAKDIFQSVAVGDVKVFDVVRATSDVLELRLKEGSQNSISANQPIITTVLSPDTDQEIFLARKEQYGQTLKQEKEILETKKQLDDIASKMNSEDYRMIDNEGFSPESYTVDGLNSALNRVKEKNINNSDQKKDEKDKKSNNKASDNSIYDTNIIKARLKSAGLLPLEENVSGIVTALNLSNPISNMNDKTMKYMISQDMEPTIGNIYKAYYSQNSQNEDQPQSISDSAWKELKPQVTEVIQDAGYEVNEENLTNARWLIENKLPLTTDSFTYKNELDNIKANSGKESILNQIVEGMKNGTTPLEVSLRNKDNTSYEQIVEDVSSISDETVEYAVKNQEELTIKNLKAIQKREQKVTSEPAVSEKNDANMAVQTTISSSYDEIKAKRQLEEIRLKLTVESAAKLEKKGFHIETGQLSKVVEELRNQEEIFYKNLLSEAGAEATDANIETLKNTTQNIEQLKYTPSYVLGTTLLKQSAQTIPSLLSEGNNLSAKLMKAGEAYDTLMTVPSKEYGDSIQKAFQNMSSLLAEMDIENTQANQRAVRILGYNQMEINQDSINKVKAYDLEVNSLIKNLNPAVTVRLIKDGVNPLDMSISELNQAIDNLKEEQGVSSEERFSTYLRKLEKDNSISAEERKGYIGIYRLLYQIEKTDGAALGSLLKSDQEVTLNHLLTAVNTLKKGSVDKTVDDSFGMLQGKLGTEETIAEQLGTVFKSQDASQDTSEQNESGNNRSEKADVIKKMAKLMEEDISPQKLKELQKENLAQETKNQSATSGIIEQLTSEEGIWDTIKGMSVEKLYEKLQNQGNNNEIEQDVYVDKLKQFKQFKESEKNIEQAIRFLNDYKISATPVNLMQMSQILSSGETPLKKFIKSQYEKEMVNTVETSETGLKELTDLSDKLTSGTSMQKAYEELEKEVKNTLSQSVLNEDITSAQLGEIKSIGAQLSLLKTLAGKEFYQIPIKTENGVTNINLTILHNTQMSGKVSAVVQSERLGNIKADFSLKGETLNGFIRCDDKESISVLQRNMDNLMQVAEEEDIKVASLNFGLQNKGTEVYDYLNKLEETDKKISSDTERKLYRIAKTMVISIRAAERSYTN